MFYEVPDLGGINLDRIIRIEKLKNNLRLGYFFQKARPEQKKWFRTILARPARYVCNSDFDGIYEVSEEEAVYDGKYLRVWFNPDSVTLWNYGKDIQFDSVEKANNFYDLVMKHNSGCKYEPSQLSS